MRSPAGKDIWSTGVYKEIMDKEELIMTDSFADAQGTEVNASYYQMPGIWPLRLLISVSFKDDHGKTRMTLEHFGIPAGEMLKQTGQGWSQSFDKLDQELRRDQAVALEGKTTFTFLSDQEILITRVFDAPRELVFQTFTDPKLVPEWWGPAIYATRIEQMDVRPGGRWRFLQQDKEGKEFAFHGEYREVFEPERVVQTFIWEGMPDHMIVETVQFEALDRKTRITSLERFQSKEDRDGMWSTGMEKGSSESMDRFAAVLRKLHAMIGS
jgi:uncharacterized protein YndB with AHSA1/START domain